MKKKNLISKWLDNNLNDQEKEAFEKLDASASYHKLDQAMKYFKGPEIDVDASYTRLKGKLPARPEKKVSLWRVASSIAAILVVALGVYFFTANRTTELQTFNGQTLATVLPDNSAVSLNAGSTLKFKANRWEENRLVLLEGEAMFEVEKGSQFTVETRHGSVVVLGTEFNVKDREDYFEVSCYEGRVMVKFMGKEQVLDPGMVFRTNDESFAVDILGTSGPSWKRGVSNFRSVPVKEVLDELERQFNVRITGDQRSSMERFTGNFTHENLETALQAVTIPLNLNYTKDGAQIVLKN